MSRFRIIDYDDPLELEELERERALDGNPRNPDEKPEDDGEAELAESLHNAMTGEPQKNQQEPTGALPSGWEDLDPHTLKLLATVNLDAQEYCADRARENFVALMGLPGPAYARQRELLLELMELVGFDEANAFWMTYYSHPFDGHDGS